MEFIDQKILIAYFSHAGENYFNGAILHLEEGNTKIVADMLHEITQGDLFYIETVHQYPDDHMKKINVAKQELEQQLRPKLKNHLHSMDDYDMIFVCYPNWWGTCPMAVFSFLEEYDFTHKTIIPLCTHEGSGASNSVEDIKRICSNSKVLTPLAIQGYRVRDSKEMVLEWLRKL